MVELYIWLCSQIGHPIDAPMPAAAQLVLHPGVALPDVQPTTEAIVARELARILTFCERLLPASFPFGKSNQLTQSR